MKRLTILLVIGFAAVASAQTGVPDLNNCVWSCRAQQDATVVISPVGGDLQAAWPADGGDPVDATIDVQMLDALNDPIPFFPAEDIWLEADGLVFCPGGSIAESDTDVDGRTTIRHLRGGGNSLGGPIRVMINGMAINGSTTYLTILSTDITGDLEVNLADLAHFASSFFGTYSPNLDFDGAPPLDLSDLVLLVQYMGVACP